MGRVINSDFEAYRTALRDAIHGALARFGEAAAIVREELNADAGVWGVVVTPTVDRAAWRFLRPDHHS